MNDNPNHSKSRNKRIKTYNLHSLTDNSEKETKVLKIINFCNNI